MEAATEAPAERTVEATVLALVETVLRQEEMILNELGNKPLFFPFPFFIVLIIIIIILLSFNYYSSHRQPQPLVGNKKRNKGKKEKTFRIAITIADALRVFEFANSVAVADSELSTTADFGFAFSIVHRCL